ncbi:MAG: flavin reductase [Clostridiales bacterium GWF2_38_85]|nr:MAG: flavin reductase [Clostridiales bacterium GWF2_38_85]HBL85165.1 flavin reductase family protein [Clostridiales bacterium]
MSKIKWKPGTLLAPVPPVMVSCGSLEQPNVLTIAWAGILNSDPPKTYISIRPSRYSYEIIKSSGEFVINLTTTALVRTADYCGVKTGKNTDKFSECKLTAERSFEVSAPSIAESPVSIECRVCEIVPLGTHDMFIADIIAVSIDDQYIDKTNKLHLEKCGLVAYAHGEYYALGKQLGSFGFSVKKKSTKKK